MIRFARPESTGLRRSLRAPRRAYILIAILGFTAIATSLGLAFLDANSTAMPEAVNLQGKVRAEYLAGSGFDIASHYLMYPPTTINLGNYWTGAANVAVDGGSDTFSVSVLRADAWSPAQSDLNQFRITAQGTARNPDGSTRARRSIQADVLAPLTGRWSIPYASLATTTLTATLPAGVSVYGDIHSNGGLTGAGWCQGKVSAVLTALWTGTGPPASITSLAAAFTSPSAVAASYAPTYVIQGRSYSAHTSYSANDMRPTDTTALNALDMSSTNPGRIIRAPAGTFRLRQDAKLNGTLVVSGGNLELDSTGIEVTAVPGFPALVVQGNIVFSSDNAAAVVTGPVVCSGTIQDGGRNNCTLRVIGACITRGGITNTGTGNQFRLDWDASRSVFWDVQNAAPRQPMTVLNWKED